MSHLIPKTEDSAEIEEEIQTLHSNANKEKKKEGCNFEALAAGSCNMYERSHLIRVLIS